MTGEKVLFSLWDTCQVSDCHLFQEALPSARGPGSMFPALAGLLMGRRAFCLTLCRHALSPAAVLWQAPRGDRSPGLLLWPCLDSQHHLFSLTTCPFSGAEVSPPSALPGVGTLPGPGGVYWLFLL